MTSEMTSEMTSDMTSDMTSEWVHEEAIRCMMKSMKPFYRGYSRSYLHGRKMTRLGKLEEYFRYVHLCSKPMEQFTPKDRDIYALGMQTRPLWTDLYESPFILQCVLSLHKHLEERFIIYVILHDVIENEFKHISSNKMVIHELSSATMANMAMLEMLKFILGKPRI